MRLGDFLKYESIVIQCHNNPDPDALASGFAVWKYLTRNGKKPVFVYGGREAVSKPNLLLMIRLFGIPVHHVKDQAEIIDLLQREREETDVLPAAGQKPDLLIMTDCQYGESNTQKFEAGMVAVIDHHEVVDPRSGVPSLPEETGAVRRGEAAGVFPRGNAPEGPHPGRRDGVYRLREYPPYGRFPR